MGTLSFLTCFLHAQESIYSIFFNANMEICIQNGSPKEKTKKITGLSNTSFFAVFNRFAHGPG